MKLFSWATKYFDNVMQVYFIFFRCKSSISCKKKREVMNLV